MLDGGQIVYQLAEAIIHILKNRERYSRSPQQIASSFNPDHTATEYLALFNDLLQGKSISWTSEPAAYETLRLMRDSTTNGIELSSSLD